MQLKKVKGVYGYSQLTSSFILGVFSGLVMGYILANLKLNLISWSFNVGIIVGGSLCFWLSYKIGKWFVVSPVTGNEDSYKSDYVAGFFSSLTAGLILIFEEDWIDVMIIVSLMISIVLIVSHRFRSK